MKQKRKYVRKKIMTPTPNAGVVSIAENTRNMSPIEAQNEIEQILSGFIPEKQNEIVTALVRNNVLRRWNERTVTNNNFNKAQEHLDVFLKMNPSAENFIKEYLDERQKM